MRKKIYRLTILGFLPFLTGCIDTNDQFTINPDGSGKVVHESKLLTFYSHGVLTSALEKQPSADDLKVCVKNILENTKGVDAWRDISYKIEDDGKIDFKGTAYFPDIRELNFDNQGTSTSAGGILFQENPNSIILEISNQTNKKAASPPAPTVPIPQTQEEIKKAVARQMLQYQQMRGFMVSLLTNLKIKETFILPGQVATMTDFQKNADGSLSIQWEGTKILAAMDQLANDTAYVTKQIKEGKNFADQSATMNGKEINKMLFGQEGPIRVEVRGPFKPLFDYGSETQEAKKEYTKTLNDLNIKNIVSRKDNKNILSPAINPLSTLNSQGSARIYPRIPDLNNVAGSMVSIILKNGTTVEGKVIEKAKDYIKLDFQGSAQTFYNDEIEKIDTHSSSPN